MYDANGTETTNTTEGVTRVFYVTLKELINDMSASQITVIKTTTSADVAIDLPTDV
jgi:hypothetical protein